MSTIQLGPLSVETVYDGRLSTKDCAIKMYTWGMEYLKKNNKYFEAAKELRNLCEGEDIPLEVQSLFDKWYEVFADVWTTNERINKDFIEQRLKKFALYVVNNYRVSKEDFLLNYHGVSMRF